MPEDEITVTPHPEVDTSNPTPYDLFLITIYALPSLPILRAEIPLLIIELNKAFDPEGEAL